MNLLVFFMLGLAFANSFNQIVEYLERNDESSNAAIKNLASAKQASGLTDLTDLF